MTDTRAQFAAWLSSRMEAAGYRSNSALARDLGVASTTVDRWRSGQVMPNIEQLRRVAKLFGLPMVELLIVAGLFSRDELLASVSIRELLRYKYLRRDGDGLAA